VSTTECITEEDADDGSEEASEIPRSNGRALNERDVVIAFVVDGIDFREACLKGARGEKTTDVALTVAERTAGE